MTILLTLPNPPYREGSKGLCPLDSPAVSGLLGVLGSLLSLRDALYLGGWSVEILRVLGSLLSLRDSLYLGGRRVEILRVLGSLLSLRDSLYFGEGCDCEILLESAVPMGFAGGKVCAPEGAVPAG
jgi:hypothetical protein